MAFQHSFQQLVQEHKNRVHQVIRTCFNADAILVQQAIEYVHAADQEHVRLMFPLLVAVALDYGKEQQYQLAAAVELIHGALDLHNQVGAPKTERGTTNSATAVLLGDLLYTSAFKLIVSLNDMPVLQILSNASNVIAEAEVRRQELGKNLILTSPQHMENLRRRSAKLFEATARCIALLAGASSAKSDVLAAYGLHVGTAYQLWHDSTTTRQGLGELTNQTITKEETNLAIEALAPLANHAFKVVLIDYASMVGEGRAQ